MLYIQVGLIPLFLVGTVYGVCEIVRDVKLRKDATK